MSLGTFFFINKNPYSKHFNPVCKGIDGYGDRVLRGRGKGTPQQSRK